MCFRKIIFTFQTSFSVLHSETTSKLGCGTAFKKVNNTIFKSCVVTNITLKTLRFHYEVAEIRAEKQIN